MRYFLRRLAEAAALAASAFAAFEPINAGRLAWVPEDAQPLPDDPTFDPSSAVHLPAPMLEHPGAALIAQWRMPWMYSLDEWALMNQYVYANLR